MADFLDVHTHTLASGHAYHTITEMIQAAKAKGLKVFGITEHAMSMPGTCHEFYFANLRVLPREYDGMTVLFGAEVNIRDFDGTLDMSEELLAQMDVCIASMHLPCMKAGSRKENTRAAIRAMEQPYISILGHPDDGRFPLDYEALVLSAKEQKVLLEVNNSSLSPNGYRKDTRENAKQLLRYCEKYAVPVIFDSDAHSVFQVGLHDRCLEVAKEVGFPEELVINSSPERFLAYTNYGKRNGFSLA